MAVTKNPLTTDTPSPYIVTRAMCIGGDRVEVGTVLDMTRANAAAMISANQVAPYVAPEPEPAKATKPAAKAAAPAAQPELS